jgi:hypothetical protein
MKIYGFGSYFSNKKSYGDIDILIVHESNEYQSCIKALEYKKLILKNIDNSDVSILSKSEELDFNFISKSQAVLLGKINENNSLSSLDYIIDKVQIFQKHNKA